MIDQPARPFVQLSESDVKPGKLTFNWNPPIANCSALYYIVNSTGCGNCTNGLRTSSTSITCSVSATAVEQQTCKFAIKSVVCSDNSSPFSNQVIVLLKGMLHLLNNTMLFKSILYSSRIPQNYQHNI